MTFNSAEALSRRSTPEVSRADALRELASVSTNPEGDLNALMQMALRHRSNGATDANLLASLVRRDISSFRYSGPQRNGQTLDVGAAPIIGTVLVLMAVAGYIMNRIETFGVEKKPKDEPQEVGEEKSDDTDTGQK